MTKMATMPIYGKKKIVSSRTELPITLKVGMQHWVLEYYQIPSDDDPRLTFDLSTQRSTLIPYAFVWENA